MKKDAINKDNEWMLWVGLLASIVGGIITIIAHDNALIEWIGFSMMTTLAFLIPLDNFLSEKNFGLSALIIGMWMLQYDGAFIIGRNHSGSPLWLGVLLLCMWILAPMLLLKRRTRNLA